MKEWTDFWVGALIVLTIVIAYGLFFFRRRKRETAEREAWKTHLAYLRTSPITDEQFKSLTQERDKLKRARNRARLLFTLFWLTCLSLGTLVEQGRPRTIGQYGITPQQRITLGIVMAFYLGVRALTRSEHVTETWADLVTGLFIPFENEKSRKRREEIDSQLAGRR